MDNTHEIEEQPFSLSGAFANTRLKPVSGILERCLEVLTGLDYLAGKYRQLPKSNKVTDFLEHILDCLQVRYSLNINALEQIPKSGPLVVVANHPFGAIDGIILTLIICSQRDDVRVLGNYFLGRLPGLRKILISVDPFGTSASTEKNLRPLRDSVRWLQQGGVIVTFPAGEVSSWSMQQQRVTDPVWSKTIGKLVQMSQASVLPVYFHGRNSLTFQNAGMVHPLLRTCLLPWELIRKQDSTIQLRLGQNIQWTTLKRLDTAEKVVRYLRFRTYLLRNISSGDTRPVLPELIRKSQQHSQPVQTAIAKTALQAEVAALPESSCLTESGEFQIFSTTADQSPLLLQEIGRLREITFRQVGEGTGKSTDIDLYDSYYHHLFLWHREKQEIVGAYRLGVVQDILPRFGRKGLYTYSLFKYKKKILPLLSCAIEVGRSFVRAEYQKSFSALNLLWKGIGIFVVRHGKCPVLFGPVSISKDYEILSRHLIVDCLTLNNFENTLSALVKPRRPYRSKRKDAWIKQEMSAIDDLSLVSDIVSELENDKKGIPVLVKQYLKLGGKFVGFNIDPDFNNVVDGLILVDLRETERQILNKYMGKERAEQFLASLQAQTGLPGTVRHAVLS